jgi:hypothetical protein
MIIAQFIYSNCDVIGSNHVDVKVDCSEKGLMTDLMILKIIFVKNSG